MKDSASQRSFVYFSLAGGVCNSKKISCSRLLLRNRSSRPIRSKSSCDVCSEIGMQQVVKSGQKHEVSQTFLDAAKIVLKSLLDTREKHSVRLALELVERKLD